MSKGDRKDLRMENTDRAWAEVSKEAILHNYAIVKSKIAPQASVMGILKAAMDMISCVPLKF